MICLLVLRNSGCARWADRALCCADLLVRQLHDDRLGGEQMLLPAPQLKASMSSSLLPARLDAADMLLR